MKKEDFISVIGYQGGTAILDKKLRRRLKNKSIQALIDKGEFKAAFCATFFTEATDRQDLLDAYNTLSGSSYSLEELERLFGVFNVPEKVKIQGV